VDGKGIEESNENIKKYIHVQGLLKGSHSVFESGHHSRSNHAHYVLTVVTRSREEEGRKLRKGGTKYQFTGVCKS
jgi:hypothetical protein